MLVQRTLFTGPHRRVEGGMYLIADPTRVEASRQTVRMDPGATVGTNTYFGRFAASYWQRYTRATQVTLRLAYECDPTTRLRVDIRASDISGRERPVEVVDLIGEGTASVDLPINRFVDGGAMWFELTAAGGGARVSDVSWSVQAPQRQRPIAVVMCTHNRPGDAIATVLTLASDALAADRIGRVYLVDQGSDRVESHPDFPQVKEALADKLHYLTQPNLGGAGGFNRGIYEVTKNGETDVDILVMDDDILCEPESVLRLSTFAAHTIEPTLVGSQMLLLSETYRVHMTGEWEALTQLKAGNIGAHGQSGFNALEKQQDIRTDAGWNGWWSCLLPGEAVAASGLSLPLFFQWDDIEFGIRARHSGFPTVTLPNAGVWHADFHLKDYDDWSRYFSWRNGLIVAALHAEMTSTQTAMACAKEIGAHIVSMRYGLAATLMLAVADYLDGPRVLADGGQSKPAELARLRARFADTRIRPAVEVGHESSSDQRISARGPEPRDAKLTQVLVKRFVQQVTGRVSPAPVAISADDANWWHVALFSSAVVTDSSQSGVRVRTRDKGTALAQARRLGELCRRLRSDNDEIKQQWRDAMPELTSRENWKRLFDGD